MSLNEKIKSVKYRIDRFRRLQEAYVNEDPTCGSWFELNDISSLVQGVFQEEWKEVTIPLDLIEEAKNLLDKEQIWNQEYFARCESFEKRLHQLLSDYQKEHSENSVCN
jgi:hypothetical protein